MLFTDQEKFIKKKTDQEKANDRVPPEVRVDI